MYNFASWQAWRHFQNGTQVKSGCCKNCHDELFMPGWLVMSWAENDAMPSNWCQSSCGVASWICQKYKKTQMMFVCLFKGGVVVLHACLAIRNRIWRVPCSLDPTPHPRVCIIGTRHEPSEGFWTGLHQSLQEEGLRSYDSYHEWWSHNW